jgi:hypothetical protein
MVFVFIVVVVVGLLIAVKMLLLRMNWHSGVIKGVVLRLASHMHANRCSSN